jgi:hypothetical protein
MAQQVQDIPGRCPYLGLTADPESYFAFPTDENACHKLTPPDTIATSYQQQYCLGNYAACPIYQQEEAWKGPLPEEAKPSPSTRRSASYSPADPTKKRRIRRSILIVVALVLVIGAGLFVVGFNVVPNLLTQSATPTSGAPAVAEGGTATSTPTPTSPAITSTATSAATATVTPTLEPSATAAPSLTPTPNNIVTVEVLEFESFIREGPDTAYDSIDLVPAGTELGVIARDLDGFWLLVELPNGTQGWVALTQFAGNPDVLNIPVAADLPPTLTPEPSPEGEGPTPTPES